jgi:hypothetical protein
MIREDIFRIPQANIQEVLIPILDRLEAIEEAMDAKFSAPEVVQVPEIERQNLNYLKEQTLEVENDYVRQNLEDTWKSKKEDELETEVVEPAPELKSDVEVLDSEDSPVEPTENYLSANYQTKDSK